MRQSIEASWWHWEPAFRVTWKHRDHINLLELRSILLSIKFHVSHLNKHVHSRIFHVSDSYVCMSVVSKGRSGSRHLNRLLKQINAYLLGFNLLLIISHVESSENPTEGASRKLEIFAIARQKPERQHERRNVLLWDAAITKKTQERYYGGLSRLLPSLQDAESMLQLDDVTSEWVQSCWESGDGLHIVNDGLCGLHHYLPWTRGQIPRLGVYSKFGGKWKRLYNRAPRLQKPWYTLWQCTPFNMTTTYLHPSFCSVSLGF